MRMRMGAQQYCRGTENDHEVSFFMEAVIASNAARCRSRYPSLRMFAHLGAKSLSLAEYYRLRSTSVITTIRGQSTIKLIEGGEHSLTSGDSC